MSLFCVAGTFESITGLFPSSKNNNTVMTAVSFPCICYNINVYALKTPSKGSLAAPWIAEHVKVHEAFLFNVAMPMSILRVRSRDGFKTLGVRSGCIVTDLKHPFLWFRSPVRCVLLTHRGPNLDNVTIVTTTITSTVPAPNCKGTAWNKQPTGFLPRRLEYAANRVLAATLHSSNDFQPWNDRRFCKSPNHFAVL